jgi:DNA-binding HxlR family transcriptional regulator
MGVYLKVGLFVRTIYPRVPPRVEYRLTDLGRGLTPVFLAAGERAITVDHAVTLAKHFSNRPKKALGL